MPVPSRAQNLHGLGEKSRDPLAALVVSTAHPAFVKLLLGAQVPVAASLDALALDTDRGGVGSTQGAVHHLRHPQRKKTGPVTQCGAPLKTGLCFCLLSPVHSP